uniref:Uncharacterized protein n=1 Tax=Nelumbo nucifera TaxID=4432 RepID=A0A822XDS7_NELNU|nr:TPA_asm: hypothetical protein HUJ06_021067 [Nelumbo nucifera]
MFFTLIIDCTLVADDKEGKRSDRCVVFDSLVRSKEKWEQAFTIYLDREERKVLHRKLNVNITLIIE